jgi:hypothetical protein
MLSTQESRPRRKRCGHRRSSPADFTGSLNGCRARRSCWTASCRVPPVNRARAGAFPAAGRLRNAPVDRESSRPSAHTSSRTAAPGSAFRNEPGRRSYGGMAGTGTPVITKRNNSDNHGTCAYTRLRTRRNPQITPIRATSKPRRADRGRQGGCRGLGRLAVRH